MNWYRLIERMRYPDRFSYAVNVVLEHEGTFSDDKADKGGATMYGISQRFLDDNKLSYHVKEITEGLAISIYKKYFWDRYHYIDFNSLAVATKVFDCAVNMGPKEAHLILQKAINNVSNEKILVDGFLGYNTFRRANACKDNLLLDNIRFEARRFYLNLINENPGYMEFRNGWLNRASS